MAWTVYVLVSEGLALTYVGITTDLPKRLRQHNGHQPGGARSTRRARPWAIGATFGPYPSRGEAQSIEARVKRRRGRSRLSFDAGAALRSRRVTRSSAARLRSRASSARRTPSAPP